MSSFLILFFYINFSSNFFILFLDRTMCLYYYSMPMDRKWYVIDADGKVLGRLATRIARVLTGKDKPDYTPHIDGGDFVICTNAEKVICKGAEKKYYSRYSGYPGGLKRIPFEKELKEHPERIIIHAVKGMLPKNKLGRRMLKRLKVYRAENHPHSAQKPDKLIDK